MKSKDISISLPPEGKVIRINTRKSGRLSDIHLMGVVSPMIVVKNAFQGVIQIPYKKLIMII